MMGTNWTIQPPPPPQAPPPKKHILMHLKGTVQCCCCFLRVSLTCPTYYHELIIDENKSWCFRHQINKELRHHPYEHLLQAQCVIDVWLACPYFSTELLY